MTLYYSPSTKGFYDTVIHNVLPPDVVQITDTEHSDLLFAQSAGKVIVPDHDGSPVAIDPPLPSVEMLWSILRRDRDSRLAAALAMLDRHRNQADFGLPTTLTDAAAKAWAVYAQALRNLPATTTDPANPIWPEVPQ